MGSAAVILEPAQQSVEALGVTDADVHQVVIRAGHVNGIPDLGHSLGPGKEARRVARRIETDVDERLQAPCRICRLGVENHPVPKDHPRLLETTHASSRRVRTEPDASTDLTEGCPPIHPQDIDDLVVRGVHTANHLTKLTEHTEAGMPWAHRRTMDIPLALLSGIVAGLALAVPLGAIGVLLVQEGVTRGLRQGLPAATAVATVDILYCAVTVTAGSVVGPIVSRWEPWPQIIGGFALVALGGQGLLGSWRSTAGEIGGQMADSATSRRRRFALFVGLTAINPATLVYFVALLPSFDQIAPSISARMALVAGVGIASFGWQASLVMLGAYLRSTTGPSFRTRTAAIGNGVVAILGMMLIATAF